MSINQDTNMLNFLAIENDESFVDCNKPDSSLVYSKTTISRPISTKFVCILYPSHRFTFCLQVAGHLE